MIYRRSKCQKDVTFNSDGLKLAGHLYIPDNVKPPYPCIVMGGRMVLRKRADSTRIRSIFSDAGYAALSFDYRNLGESEGEIKQHINP